MTTEPHICTCGDCESEAFADRCKYEAAFVELYDLAIKVVAITHPDWKSDRKRMSLRLDRFEALRSTAR
jgi:hypothetical protein